ncbi:hypothetical protein BK131_02825 [Paenibacillus amylolyticus]|uniref:Uncharacterized protein n=1 Tax=Paenibacillus amylolyticus TaxID=1451 RepID=A0A1R1C4H7_PAEAM|nr:hypothetical protein [Paenibacillus amylolyticus]OMF16937.1 hypothetical protein BK131_02825 [Paenibacillus amylolyticus]
MNHDIAEFFQGILLNIDMFHNLQRLEPASAGLLVLDGKVTAWCTDEHFLTNDDCLRKRLEWVQFAHERCSQIMILKLYNV